MIILGLLPAACMSLPPSLWWALPLAVLPWVHSVDVHARLNANVCKVLPHISYTTYLLNPLYGDLGCLFICGLKHFLFYFYFF